MAGRRSSVIAIAIILLGLSGSSQARSRAQHLDKATYLTFNKPVSLPGVSLRAGTYIFEIADPLGAWEAVRVSSADRRVVYLAAFTNVVDRPAGLSPRQPISFGEAPPDQPPPIAIWWPEGESTGRQFIY